MQYLEHYISKEKEQEYFDKMVKVNSETMLEAYVNFEHDCIEQNN